MRRLLAGVVALLLATPAVLAQSGSSVRQSGNVTPNTVPYWVTSGVIGGGVTAADSPITSFGVTSAGGNGICVSSDRLTAAGRNQLCLGASTTGPGFVSLQNYGTAAAQNLQFIINGTPVTIPTGGNTFLFGNGPFTNADVPCFSGTSGLIVDCGLALNAGTVTAGTWQGTAVAVGFGGTGANTAAGARTNLGLGTIATQNANGVAVTGGTITGMPSPSNPTDVAIKSYVDSTSTGLNILAPSTLATAAVLPNTPTYTNGASGVGATLTSSTNTTLTVDGTAAPLNTVVLVKNQAAPAQNGIYTVTTAGGGVPWVLTRATYFDQAAEMKVGSYTFITSGSTNASSAWTNQSTVVTVGTDPLNFVQFSLSGSGTVTNATVAAGTGISVSGTCAITSTGTCTVTNSGVVTVKKQIFTSSGTYTPSTGMLFAQIECVGSGGGGGGVAGVSTGFNGGGGGGGGSYSRVLAAAVTVGVSQVVTIGTAGIGGNPGANNGNSGGDTSVGSICVGKGGSGGGGVNGIATISTGGAGGVAGTGDLTLQGSSGGASFISSTVGAAATNWGGAAAGGYSSPAKTNIPIGSNTSAGAGGYQYGGGGSGALFNNASANAGGGAGAAGIVVITEYNSQ